MGQILSSLLEIFYTKKLDIVVIGLENRCVCFPTPPMRDVRRCREQWRACCPCFLVLTFSLVSLHITHCTYQSIDQSINYYSLHHQPMNQFTTATIVQWKDHTSFRSCAWSSRGNCPYHWFECQSLSKRKGKHEMLGHWRTRTIPIRMVAIHQGMRCRLVRGGCRGAPKVAHGTQGIAQIVGRWIDWNDTYARACQ